MYRVLISKDSCFLPGEMHAVCSDDVLEQDGLDAGDCEKWEMAGFRKDKWVVAFFALVTRITHKLLYPTCCDMQSSFILGGPDSKHDDVKRGNRLSLTVYLIHYGVEYYHWHVGQLERSWRASRHGLQSYRTGVDIMMPSINIIMVKKRIRGSWLLSPGLEVGEISLWRDQWGDGI